MSAVRISEILIAIPEPQEDQVTVALKKAEEVREAILRGEDFATLAKLYSQGPTAVLGGDLGYFKRGQMAPSLEDVVFAMRVGEVSDVIQTKQGFTILKVTNRVAQAELPVQVLSQQVTPELTPYVQEISKKILERWYAKIPSSAREPQLKQGTVAIEFVIEQNGTVADEKIDSSSGYADFDKAALNAIKKASPFPPLTNVIKADHLGLRFRFLYNTGRGMSR